MGAFPPNGNNQPKMALLPWYRPGCWSASDQPHWTIAKEPNMNLVFGGFGQIPDFDGKRALVGHCELLVCCRFYIVLSRGADLTVLHLSSLQQDSVHDNQPDVTPWSSKKEETNDKKSRKISCSE
jgi:hypothetical protein